MHSPRPEHFEVVYRILRYLKGTSGKGILFRKNEDQGIQGFVNADWVGSLEDSKSTSKYSTKVWGTCDMKKQETKCSS